MPVFHHGNGLAFRQRAVPYHGVFARPRPYGAKLPQKFFRRFLAFQVVVPAQISNPVQDGYRRWNIHRKPGIPFHHFFQNGASVPECFILLPAGAGHIGLLAVRQHGVYLPVYQPVDTDGWDNYLTQFFMVKGFSLFLLRHFLKESTAGVRTANHGYVDRASVSCLNTEMVYRVRLYFPHGCQQRVILRNPLESVADDLRRLFQRRAEILHLDPRIQYSLLHFAEKPGVTLRQAAPAGDENFFVSHFGPHHHALDRRQCIIWMLRFTKRGETVRIKPPVSDQDSGGFHT